MANKKKVTTAVVAVATAAALMLGGTFAWQSISQTALNEASDVINPGGRLHDDFNGENKDVYVENFADDPIYARIQLSEYFEIIANYQFLQDEDETNDHLAVSTPVLGSKSEDGTYIYDTFYFDGNVDENGVVSAGNDAEGTSYWSWQTGGETVYMPTFNMNKDSLQADINGIYEDGNVGTISNRVLEDQYSEYMEYTDGETETGDEIYDADANDIEDDGITTISSVEHTAKSTESGSLISMEQWKTDKNGEAGPYWVYDTDGWVYWAQAIEPDTATGLLLDGIELNQVMDDTWYYAINVEAQFVTADDVGKTDGTGFYADGQAPTAAAEALLEAIGVDMSGEATDEGDTKNGFRIYSVADDDGTNYADGTTVTLDAGTYRLYVSNGTGGHYVGENQGGFVWSVSPETLAYTESVTEYDAAEDDYYVSIEFTLDESVPAGTYTVTAGNEADGINRTAYIEWCGDGSEADSESALTMSVDMKEPIIDGWIYPEVTITSSTDPNFTYNHSTDLSYIDIKFYTDEDRTNEASTEDISYNSSDCSYIIYKKGTYYYTATYTNGDLTASCKGVVEYYKPEVNFDLSVNYDSDLVSYDYETNTYTMSTSSEGYTKIEFTLTGAIGEESVDVSLIGEESIDETKYERDSSLDGASATGFTYYNDTNGQRVFELIQGEDTESSPDASLPGANLYHVNLYPIDSSFSVSFTYYYNSIEYDTITVNFVVDIQANSDSSN